MIEIKRFKLPVIRERDSLMVVMRKRSKLLVITERERDSLMVVIRKRSKFPVIQTSCVTSRTNGSNEKKSYKKEEQKTKTRFQRNMFS